MNRQQYEQGTTAIYELHFKGHCFKDLKAIIDGNGIELTLFIDDSRLS